MVAFSFFYVFPFPVDFGTPSRALSHILHTTLLRNGLMSLFLRFSSQPSRPSLHHHHREIPPHPPAPIHPSIHPSHLLELTPPPKDPSKRPPQTMGKVPLAAKLGDNVEVAIVRPPTPAPAPYPPAPAAVAAWHLPYWSGDYEVVISPPWLIALAMIALGLAVLAVSACRSLRRRKMGARGEKGRRVRLSSYPPLRMSSSCSIV